ncbi:MAG: glycosyltransferase [Oscillospiraceae bacterium]|jgi:glycosyltransferase involved in cell wall biosynthesis|nr:glycosyltransferase [Oscillospiraceae bacterium]
MDNHLIKISVIIPVYNVERYLRDCLDSIIRQTLREIEIICVNDGSTDSSLTILEDYKALDERVQVITQENKGLSGARNTGIDRVKGKYIYFIDSDDMLKTDALIELYTFAERENTDVLFFDSEVIYESDEIIGKCGHLTKNYYIRKHDYSKVKDGPGIFSAMMENEEYRCMACMQLIKAEHINTYNLRFYEGIYHEDDLFTFLCLMQASRVAHINKPLYIRRVRADSIMTTQRGFRHFKGYLTGFIQILSFLTEKKYTNELQSSVISLLEAMKRNLIAIYEDTDGSHTWQSLLNATEQYFTIFIIPNKK